MKDNCSTCCHSTLVSAEYSQYNCYFNPDWLYVFENQKCRFFSLPKVEAKEYTSIRIAEDVIKRIKFPADRALIRKELKKYPVVQHISIMKQYIDNYKLGMSSKDKSHQKEGEGRRRANSTLLNQEVVIDWCK